ncbi:MAG: hypothetical protein R3B47_04775 [Bacteroidia bacterium]
MKQQLVYFFGFMLVFAACAGPVKKYAFFTQGNCPECEQHIVGALEKQAGIDSVGWDFEMGLTVVKFRPDRISPEAIQQLVANRGFRTQFYAEDTVAARDLPACCREAVSRKLKRQELVIPSH